MSADDDEAEMDRMIEALERKKRLLKKKEKLKAEVAALEVEVAEPVRTAVAASAPLARQPRRPPVASKEPNKVHGLRFTQRQVKGSRTEWTPVGNVELSDATVKAMADWLARELREVQGSARIQLKFKSSLNATSSNDLILLKRADQRLTRETIAAQLDAQLAKIAGGSDGVWELTHVVLLKRTAEN
jgi:hypothetical protein